MTVEKSKKSIIMKWCRFIVLSFSFAVFSLQQLLHYDWIFMILTAEAAYFGALIFLICDKDKIYAYIKSHPKLAAALFLAALIIAIEIHRIRGTANINLTLYPLPFRFFRLRWCVFSSLSIFYLLVWIWKNASGFLTGFWDKTDRTGRKIYAAAVIVSSAVILLLYVLNPSWYTQFDRVYSIDSGWCFKSIYQLPYYYDIRHPLLSVITFPIWAVVHFVLGLFVPANLLDGMCAAVLQIINVQFLLLIGFILERLTGSRRALYLYLASSPVLIFTLFFEKYQICTVLLVLYAYFLCRSESYGRTELILAAGAMPTSSFIAVYELFIREPIGRKLKRIGCIIGKGVMILVCFGRIHLLNPSTLMGEVSTMAHAFGFKSYSLRERITSFVNMVQGSFFSLSSEGDKTYIWTSVIDNISALGVIILAVIFLGIIVGRRERFVRLCAVWLAASAALFLIFQWSVHTSPLFSIYFSWAMIPLFVKGLDFIIEKTRLKSNMVYSVLTVSMLSVNILTLVDIGMFLK